MCVSQNIYAIIKVAQHLQYLYILMKYIIINSNNNLSLSI